MGREVCDGSIGSLDGQHVQFTGSFSRYGERWLRGERAQVAELHGARVAAEGTRGRYLTILILGDLAQVQVTDPVHHRSKHGVWVAGERDLGNHICLTNQDGFEDLLAGLPTPCLQTLNMAGDTVDLALPTHVTHPTVATSTPEFAVRRARQIPVHGLAARSVDLAGLDRGSAAHEATLRLLEAHLDPVVAFEITTVPVDVAWFSHHSPATLNIAEIKSVTGTNQAHQIRLAIGQLIDYRATLSTSLPRGFNRIRAFLALEREPDGAPRWQAVTESVGITLTWAPGFPNIGS